MRVLLIQFQPHRAPGLNPERVIDLIARFASDCLDGAGYHFTEGIDEVRWMNFQFSTNNLPALWARIRETVFSEPEMSAALARSVMVLCHGDDGWNDYLLLHNFDLTEPLDSFE